MCGVLVLRKVLVLRTLQSLALSDAGYGSGISGMAGAATAGRTLAMSSLELELSMLSALIPLSGFLPMPEPGRSRALFSSWLFTCENAKGT